MKTSRLAARLLAANDKAVESLDRQLESVQKQAETVDPDDKGRKLDLQAQKIELEKRKLKLQPLKEKAMAIKRVVARLQEVSKDQAVKPHNWYIVDVSSEKDVIVAGPFGDSHEAFAIRDKKGWSDKANGRFTHSVLTGQDCIDNGVTWNA